MATRGLKARWTSDGLYIFGGSIVGTVSQGANKDWYANGCLDDWEDTRLGSFAKESQAKKAVTDWVKNHD